MFQNTLSRLKKIKINTPIVICNEEHRFFVAEQLRQLNIEAKIILEPFSRNTAPAIELASLNMQKDSLMLVLAADIIINDEKLFVSSIKKAISLADKGGLVTFGVTPSSPHTGYGYIKKGKANGYGYEIDEFKEKPSIGLAKKYVASGSFLWNCGMFLFKAGEFSKELSKYRPDISNACKSAVKDIKKDLDFFRINADEFRKCPAESIDVAVMEKTNKSSVIPLESDWADAGSWSSLWEISEKDSEGNVLRGDVVTHNTINSYIRSEDILVTTLGIENLIIVSTKDALLVADKNSDQDLKTPHQTKNSSRSELDSNREVFRPWGKYDSLSISDYYQVKKITVKPDAKLSLQLHNHRSEHWVVISGQAKVTIGENTFILNQNESTYIPAKTVHSLENETEEDLEIIEIQTGSYFGEDDIIRLEDKYGRDVNRN